MSKEAKTLRYYREEDEAQERVRQIKEAVASCKLDGDTMDCEKCKANIRKQVIEEIEKLFSHNLMTGPQVNAISSTEWQQFKEVK